MKIHLIGRRIYDSDFDEMSGQTFTMRYSVCGCPPTNETDDFPQTCDLEHVTCGQCLRRVNADRNRAKKIKFKNRAVGILREHKP